MFAKEIGRPLQEISGLGIPSPAGMLFTAPRPYTPLNELPMTARDLTERYRNSYFSEWFTPLASITRCSFCALWSITGGNYLRRDPDNVIEELLTIKEPNVCSLPTLLKFGLHGVLLRLRLFGTFLKRVRAAHLDY